VYYIEDMQSICFAINEQTIYISSINSLCSLYQYFEETKN